MTNALSISIGVLITWMITANGLLAGVVGNNIASIFIHLTGFILITLIVIIKKLDIRPHRDTPIYLYSAGVIGVFTIFANNLSFQHLGITVTLVLGLLGQSILSLIIDHYGLFGMKKVKFTGNKLVGLLLLIAGVTVMTLY